MKFRLDNVFTIIFLITGISISTFFWGKNIGGRQFESEYEGYQEYGQIRVPILNGCELSIEPNEMEVIDDIDIVYFNIEIRGSNSRSYLDVKHRGLTVDVLNYIYTKMEDCIPNAVGEYDSLEKLTSDINLFVRGGIDARPIYILIEKGSGSILSYR